jgi:hypothetical protein
LFIRQRRKKVGVATKTSGFSFSIAEKISSKSPFPESWTSLFPLKREPKIAAVLRSKLKEAWLKTPAFS